ncbi:hypothetical protein M8J76_003713 [Diaphorina citri]|nr:hypothetical protein M8J75_015957 [Diaphorina citri]KAI5723277.1 hypothetical protein M8J76_003713 [Diaphorina citri]
MGFLFQVLIRFCVLLEVKHLTADKIDLGHSGERDVLYLMLNRHSGQNKITPFESNEVNLNTFTARPNLNTFSAPKEYRVRQYRSNLVRSIQRYLSYLEREWEAIDRNELPHVLLGLTVAQAQLQMSQITPNPNPLLQYLTLKTNQVRTLFLKLILEDSNNRQLWTRVFDPKLWRISETLRMLRENDREFPNFDGNGRTFAKVRGNERDFAKFRGNGRAFTKFSERDRSFTKFRGNDREFTNRPESPSCDNVERGAYFRETRLREKSNECLQDLLTECSSSEECRDLMMEPAGGYSLAHQTLYFILARQNNCTVLDKSEISIRKDIFKRCNRMSNVNDAILSMNGTPHINDDRDVNCDIDEKIRNNIDALNIGMDAKIRTDINGNFLSETYNSDERLNNGDIDIGIIQPEGDINAKNIYDSSMDTKNIYNPYTNAKNIYKPYTNAKNIYNLYTNAKNIYNPYINARNIYNPYTNAKNMNNPNTNAKNIYNPYTNAKNMNDPNSRGIAREYLDLYIENCVVCGMEGYMEFLSPELGQRILLRQNERGCFDGYEDSCDHHMSAVSIAFLSMQLRLFA